MSFRQRWRALSPRRGVLWWLLSCFCGYFCGIFKFIETTSPNGAGGILDPLTGGGNNAASFKLRCRQLAAATPGTPLPVRLNVKDFKLINENFGSEEGTGPSYIMNCLNKAVGPEGSGSPCGRRPVFPLPEREGSGNHPIPAQGAERNRQCVQPDAEHPYYLIPSARGLHCGRSCAGGHGDPGPGQDRLPQSNG